MAQIEVASTEDVRNYIGQMQNLLDQTTDAANQLQSQAGQISMRADVYDDFCERARDACSCAESLKDQFLELKREAEDMMDCLDHYLKCRYQDGT